MLFIAQGIPAILFGCLLFFILPNSIAKNVPKNHLMSESEWRAIGVGTTADAHEVQGAPALLETGHSANGARREGIEIAQLVTLPSQRLRVALSSFGGEHTLLLVRKKVGMERVSILDGDKQGGGGFDFAGDFRMTPSRK